MSLPGVVPSPNIWHHGSLYEVENRAADPDGLVDAALRDRHDWRGQTVLDIGCGTGFHLPDLAGDAAEVVGVEPHAPLVAAARARLSRLPRDVGRRVRLLHGTAQALPLPDGSVDVALARWAYFFGPGCEPGLAELRRVVRRGGIAFVVDVDATRSTFGAWFQQSHPRHDAVAVERFWARQGWCRESVATRWRFDSRDDLESVMRIELPGHVADRALAEHPGTEVDYAVVVRWRRQ
jgi:SAM-dependent methyltransferase